MDTAHRVGEVDTRHSVGEGDTGHAVGNPAARDRILTRVREALANRARAEHPGPFDGHGFQIGRTRTGEPGRFSGNAPAEGAGAAERAGAAEGARTAEAARTAEGAGTAADALATFRDVLAAAGGEVVAVADEAAAAQWLRDFAGTLEAPGADGPPTVCPGSGVPEVLRDVLPAAPPETAALGLSMARGAVAETGSLVMDARDGRRAQLLPPVHVVLVAAETVQATLFSALRSMRQDLPSAVGLHSGPSKSADLGQVVVTGVHGPGRVIALVLEHGTSGAT